MLGLPWTTTRELPTSSMTYKGDPVPNIEASLTARVGVAGRACITSRERPYEDIILVEQIHGAAAVVRLIVLCQALVRKYNDVLNSH